MSNNGDPEEPGSVTPISQPPPAVVISQVCAPALLAWIGWSLSLHTFIISPAGWWIPTVNSGVISDLSHPANTLSHSSGIAWFISTSAKSEPASLALSVAPLKVIFVGPFVLLAVVAQTGSGLIHPNLKAQFAGFE